MNEVRKVRGLSIYTRIIVVLNKVNKDTGGEANVIKLRIFQNW